MANKLAPVHPGEVLLEEFLIPLKLSQCRLAKSTGVPPRRINEIVHGKRAVTADTALRLARFFGTSERFWLNPQTQYDLEVAKDKLAGRLEKEVAVLGAGGQLRVPQPQLHRLQPHRRHERQRHLLAQMYVRPAITEFGTPAL